MEYEFVVLYDPASSELNEHGAKGYCIVASASVNDGSVNCVVFMQRQRREPSRTDEQRGATGNELWGDMPARDRKPHIKDTGR